MSKKVLVIDDDSFIRTVVGMALGGSEWSVVEASSGAQGLELARAGNVDAILLDVIIPDMSGTEIYAELTADPSTSGIPVIFLSAATDEAERLKATGALGIIDKPFDPMTFSQTFTDLLSRAKKGP